MLFDPVLGVVVVAGQHGVGDDAVEHVERRVGSQRLREVAAAADDVSQVGDKLDVARVAVDLNLIGDPLRLLREERRVRRAV